MAENKAELKALCRGNRTDRGWTQNEDGNWVASVFDRRRIGVAELHLIAEVNEMPGLPMFIAFQVLTQRHSTGDEDAKALLENFEKWMQNAG